MYQTIGWVLENLTVINAFRAVVSFRVADEDEDGPTGYHIHWDDSEYGERNVYVKADQRVERSGSFGFSIVDDEGEKWWFQVAKYLPISELEVSDGA